MSGYTGPATMTCVCLAVISAAALAYGVAIGVSDKEKGNMPDNIIYATFALAALAAVVVAARVRHDALRRRQAASSFAPQPLMPSTGGAMVTPYYQQYADTPDAGGTAMSEY